MPATAFPEWPQDAPTHPLIVVDYQLLKANDKDEIAKLWKAATEIGFWYMKNHETDEEASDMFDMSCETIQLPLEEKMKFEQGNDGMSFGYKAAGAWAVNEVGVPDSAEFVNISKDDVVAWPRQAHRAYPATVNARMESTLIPFVFKSLKIVDDLLNVFNDRLGLPKGTLSSAHTLEEHSGTEARCIRNPPRPNSEKRSSLAAHSDFGSITLLHNRLGGLQVLVPGSETWQYVKPIPGHVICNLGDAMTIFSGGLLRSNMHRVIAPPGEQAKHPRWSLAFLSRPGNSVVLRAFVEQSPVIAEAVAKRPQQNFETGSTAGEWFSRRIKNQRLENRKGPETWRASRGTEHAPEIY